jgi:hypothetical protein
MFGRTNQKRPNPHNIFSFLSIMSMGYLPFSRAMSTTDLSMVSYEEEGIIIPMGLRRSPPNTDSPWYLAMNVMKKRWVLSPGL